MEAVKRVAGAYDAVLRVELLRGDKIIHRLSDAAHDVVRTAVRDAKAWNLGPSVATIVLPSSARAVSKVRVGEVSLVSRW